MKCNVIKQTLIYKNFTAKYLHVQALFVRTLTELWKRKEMKLIYCTSKPLVLFSVASGMMKTSIA